MHIAFDAKRLYNNFTGLGNYSRQLVSDLVNHFPEHEYALFTPKIKHNSETEVFSSHPKLRTYESQSAPKAYWRSVGIKKELLRQKVQIYHGLSHEIPFGIHKTKIKSVVSMHDLVIKHYPHYFPFLDRTIYDWKFRYACEHADQVVAISASTKRDIVQFYEIDPKKITVILQTCHPRFKRKWTSGELNFIQKKYDLPQDYLLYVGSIIPRKNLLKVVEALAQLPKSLQLPLVVVGNGKKYKQQVVERIKELKLSKFIRFIQPQFSDLPAFYQLAELFIYPSDYEGFGIPILEALYAHIPVITARNSSLPEAGGGGAHYIDFIDAEHIARAIEKLLTDSNYAQQLRLAGQQHLANFESENISRQWMDVYHKLIADGNG